MLLAPKAEFLTERLSASQTLGLLLQTCLGFVRRQFWVMLACLFLAFVAGASYLLITPSTYTASATMLIESRKGGVQQKSVLGDAPIDTGWIDSQIGVLAIEREQIGQLVAKKLELAKRPEIFEPDDGIASNLIGAITSLFHGQNDNDSAPEKSEEELTQRAAGEVARRLEVKRLGFSYLVNINFSSHSHQLAVKVANAASDAYLVAELKAKSQNLRQASDWLQERYHSLREQASDAERAVIEFKSKNNIVTAGGKLINDLQLTEINNRIGEARAKTADQQARLNQIEAVLAGQQDSGTVDTTVADALNNPIVTRLRGQYLDIVNKEADWSKRWGRDHKAVVNLRNQARDIRTSTHEELKRIAESYKSDLEIAKRNQAGLEKELAAIVFRIPNEAQISLRGLETSAQSYRTLYDNFLQNYTESVQQQSSPIPETRVIAYASGANKSHPSTPRVAIMTILAGIALGIGLGVLREALDRSFRTTAQVQTELQTDCLALIPRWENHSGWSIFSRQQLLTNPKLVNCPAAGTLRLVKDAPFSRFAEALRGLKLAADLRGERGTAKVIGLTSALPREGKSTIAAALAGLIGQSGGRVILVDCDLRNPALSRSLAPSADAGLIDVLAGDRSLEQTIWTEPGTDLAFLPAGNVSRLTNSVQILRGDALKRLFGGMRLKYDYIIVDLSPLAPVVDVRATTDLVDSYIFLIEWGHTKVDVVKQALKEAGGIYDNLLGVVLNKVDTNLMARYEGYRAQYYRNKSFARYGYKD